MLAFELFSGVSDQRQASGRRYSSAPFLMGILLAVLCGATSFRKIAQFMEIRREQLNDLFDESWKATPSYGAVRNLLLGLKEEDIEEVVRQQGSQLSEADVQESKRFIAIDGKVLRGSAQRLENSRAKQLLSVFGQKERIVLGQWEIDEKTNEIPVAQKIIQELGLSECIFTLDALHCQKKHCKPPKHRGLTCWCRSKATSLNYWLAARAW